MTVSEHKLSMVCCCTLWLLKGPFLALPLLSRTEYQPPHLSLVLRNINMHVHRNPVTLHTSILKQRLHISTKRRHHCPYPHGLTDIFCIVTFYRNKFSNPIPLVRMTVLGKEMSIMCIFPESLMQ